MKEEAFSIPTGDGFTIYGRINRAEQASGKAAVFCHGLTCSMNDHHLQAAKRYFAAHGYDAILFNFYGGEDDARRVEGCSVAVHVADLNLILEHFAPLYEKIFVAGHSYGGLTVLSANPSRAAAVSLWDATFVPSDKDPWAQFWVHDKTLDTCIANWPPLRIILGKKVYEEKMAVFTRDGLENIAQAFTRPAQVLAAGGFEMNLGHQRALYDSVRSEKAFYAVPGAGHMFSEGDTVFDLLETTYQWFERY